jgi:hypothetical protein
MGLYFENDADNDYNYGMLECFQNLELAFHSLEVQ